MHFPIEDDPFSHPSGSSVILEKALLCLFLYYKLLCLFFVFLAIDLSAHPTTGGTRKSSVPVRVHSVYKICGFVRPADVQPVVDSRHGRIACKKLFPCSSPIAKLTEVRPPPIRP